MVVEVVRINGIDGLGDDVMSGSRLLLPPLLLLSSLLLLSLAHVKRKCKTRIEIVGAGSPRPQSVRVGGPNPYEDSVAVARFLNMNLVVIVPIIVIVTIVVIVVIATAAVAVRPSPIATVNKPLFHISTIHNCSIPPFPPVSPSGATVTRIIRPIVI